MNSKQRVIQTNDRRGEKGQRGFALVTAVVILVLVSSVVVNLIDYSSQEMQAGGRSRSSSKNLHAADSGIQLGLQRIQKPLDTAAFAYNLTDGTRVESRTRNDATPQDIEFVGNGPPSEVMEIKIGGGYVNELYQLNVIALGVNSGLTELEARLGSLQPNTQ